MLFSSCDWDFLSYTMDPHDELLKKVGLKLRHLIKDKDYKNVEHFAYDIGVSRMTLLSTLQGKQNWQAKTFFKMLDGLDISVKEFFSDIETYKD